MSTSDSWTDKSTYFLTSAIAHKRQLLQSTRMADLFIDVLYHYRGEHHYLLHEFVVMPDHVHVLITPNITLERAAQLIKGGFSYRARHELGLRDEIWQAGFYDRRVRDEIEYANIKNYIRGNPVRRGLITGAADYAFSSANLRWPVDGVPQRLKPLETVMADSLG